MSRHQFLRKAPSVFLMCSHEGVLVIDSISRSFYRNFSFYINLVQSSKCVNRPHVELKTKGSYSKTCRWQQMTLRSIENSRIHLKSGIIF